MYLELHREGPIMCVTLNRPPANAMSPDLLDEIAVVFAKLATDDDCQAVVLTGTGQVFCAGMDLKFAATADAAGSDRVLHAFNRAFAAVYGLEKPVIAALNGHAIAGGMVLALCCDFRIAPSDHGSFGLTEVRVGVPFPEVAFNIIENQLPANALRRMVQYGQNLSSADALASGAIDELVPSTAVRETAFGKARQALGIPAGGYAAVKRQLRGAVLERNRALVAAGADRYQGGWLNDEARAAALQVLRGGG